MSFKSRMHDPSTVMRIGMVCLIVFASLNFFLRPTTEIGMDWADAVRGLFLGLSVGFNLWAVRLNRGGRCGSHHRHGAAD